MKQTETEARAFFSCCGMDVTLYGPHYGAMQVGWGPLAGPSCRGRPLFPRKAGRASFLAISGHKPVGTRQTSDRPDLDSTDRGAEPSFPGRPGPARTEGQSPVSQADQDQHRPRPRALFPGLHQGLPSPESADDFHRVLLQRLLHS